MSSLGDPVCLKMGNLKISALAAVGDMARTELAVLARRMLIGICGTVCAQCGNPTHMLEGGYKRQCVLAGLSIFRAPIRW